MDPAALAGQASIPDHAAYAQNKLALTMWTNQLAHELGDRGPAVFSVDPGSLLATKMVTEGDGIQGNDIAFGVDTLTAPPSTTSSHRPQARSTTTTPLGSLDRTLTHSTRRRITS